MTALTLYGSNVASTTLSTAAQLSTTTGGTETSTTTTAPNDSTQNFMEWLSRGGTGTDSASSPAPSGKGLLYDSSALFGQTIAAGNWGFVFRANDTSNFTSITFALGVYKYASSGGAYTSIGTLTLASQSMSSTTTAYTFSSTGLSAVSFATNEYLYFQLICHPITGHWSGDPMKIFLSNSASAGVANDFVVTTPGYSPTAADKKFVSRFFQFATADKKFVTRFKQQVAAQKKFTTRFYSVDYHKKYTTRFFQYVTADKKFVTRFKQYGVVPKAYTTRFNQYDPTSTVQMLYDDLHTQYNRLRASAISSQITTLAFVYYPPAVVLSEHTVPGELDVLLAGETIDEIHALRSVQDVTDFIEEHMGATTLYVQPSQLITATSGNSGQLSVSGFKELAVDINISGKQGTSPTIQFFIDRIDAANVANNLWTSSSYTTSPQAISTNLGAGLSSQSLAGIIQYRWVIGGTSTPGWTYSVSIIAK